MTNSGGIVPLLSTRTPSKRREAPVQKVAATAEGTTAAQQSQLSTIITQQADSFALQKQAAGKLERKARGTRSGRASSSSRSAAAIKYPPARARAHVRAERGNFVNPRGMQTGNEGSF